MVILGEYVFVISEVPLYGSHLLELGHFKIVGVDVLRELELGLLLYYSRA